MKDRWKIFWTAVVIAVILGIIVGTITASFKRVWLQEYGILYYTIYQRVNNQSARANGNFLVGLDYDFYKFPRNIISIDFNTSALTKDMSMIDIEGHFSGRLIMSQVMAMYENYGFEYIEFLRASVEQYTREAVQAYSLSDLISSRVGVENNVRGLVCLKIQNDYAWIQCDYVSLGNVGANIPEPQIIPVETSFEQKQIQLLQRQITAITRLNFYISGGAQITKNLQQLNAQLFSNISNFVANAAIEVTSSISDQPTQQAERGAAMRYYLQKANFPTLNNIIALKM